MAQNLTGFTKEELEQALREKTAQERKTEMESTGLSTFISEVGTANSIEEAYRLASNFKWKVEQYRRVLVPSDGKRGRPKTK